MPSMERVLELRGAAFADDVEVSESMCTWTEDRIINFFESGGDSLCVSKSELT